MNAWIHASRYMYVYACLHVHAKIILLRDSDNRWQCTTQSHRSSVPVYYIPTQSNLFDRLPVQPINCCQRATHARMFRMMDLRNEPSSSTRAAAAATARFIGLVTPTNGSERASFLGTIVVTSSPCRRNQFSSSPFEWPMILMFALHAWLVPSSRDSHGDWLQRVLTMAVCSFHRLLLQPQVHL